MALFSASKIGRGKVAKPEVGRLGAEERFITAGSFELQLDIPKAASNPSDITVQATRNGVQNFTLVTSFLDITITLLLFSKPKRIENHRHLTLFAHILDRRQLPGKRCS